MQRTHHLKQPKPSERRSAHKFQQHAQPKKVKNIRIINSTNEMLKCLTQIKAAATNSTTLDTPELDMTALINSLHSLLPNSRLSRQSSAQIQLSLMWLLVTGITLANASKILPEADTCAANRILGTLDYLGDGNTLAGDGCSARDIHGTFDESCKTVSVIDEYRHWGNYPTSPTFLNEVCNYAIDCINRATGELQHYGLETTWRSINGYNMSYVNNQLIESWRKSNGFFGYDGFYTKEITPNEGKVCEIPSDEVYFKLTQ